jgi:TolB-like protein/DNA-binding winged helix-turn-helix (wHTH) protein/Flp pilus assembly protein TadD
MAHSSTPRRFRFGIFELDARSGELRRDGVKVRLQEQPFQALLMLIEHAGDVVTREELRRHVWRDETFVDFDHGLNSIVNRLREALGDSGESPVFIQTLPRRGYRFLAPVEEVSTTPAAAGAPVPPPPHVATAPVMPEVVEMPHTAPRFGARGILMIAIVATLAGGAYLASRLIGARAVFPAVGQARLAVLPFANLTGDQEQQFFVDGLHEEMIFRLGRMQPQRLAVVARTSVMPYRDGSHTIAAIARDLDVDYVLEGSVRRAGERFRITAQLIRADDESHLWTETYDRGWTDLFAIQTDVGARVADSLAVELVPSYQAAVERDAKVSPQAYEHYLRGRFYWNQRTRDSSSQLARAIEQFKLAIAAEPDYALAYVGLADAYDSIVFSDPGFSQDEYPKAREAIHRALQLDQRLASAHATLAWMTMHFEHDWALAERAFGRALELDPSDSLARFRYSHLLAVRGRLPEAETEARAARASDPLSAPITNILAWYSFYGGADTQALQRMREAADLEGNQTRFHAFAAYVYAVRGDCDRAATELGRFPHAADTFPRTSEAAFALARCGDAMLAEGLRQELVARRMAYPAAMVHFGRGEMEAFYDWLNRAIDARSPEPLYIGMDPAFRRERQDPRLQAALRRLGM